MAKVIKWIDHNRFVVIAPIAGLIIWIAAVGCTALTPSPTQAGKMADAAELETEFSVWQLEQQEIMIKFDAARADLEKQRAQWNEFQQILITLASGGVADWAGLVQLLISGGAIGAIADNIRKRGLIAGLKRNHAE